jgi:hypothetical protein
VALKIEKKDKNKSILIFEYNVLNVLKGKLVHLRFILLFRAQSCLQRLRFCEELRVESNCHGPFR